MSKIEVLREAQRRLANAERYFGMLNETGHLHQIGRVHEAGVKNFTIYYQEYAGAPNYHPADSSLLVEISDATAEHGRAIAKTVLKKLQQRVEDAATAAKAEALEVIAIAEKAVAPVQPESHEQLPT